MFDRYNQNRTNSYVEDSLKHDHVKVDFFDGHLQLK